MQPLESSSRRATPLELTRRHMLLGGALLAASAAAFARQPVVDDNALAKGALEKMVPNKLGPWRFQTSSGLVLPPPDELSDRLYDQLMTRVYTAPDLPPVMFLIAYSGKQDGMLQVHRPEFCYPNGGFKLSQTTISSVSPVPNLTIPVRYFSAEGAVRSEQVMYWTRIGDDMPTDWLDQRLAVVRKNLVGVIPDGILVRISTAEPDLKDALPNLELFVKALAESLGSQGRKVILGAA